VLALVCCIILTVETAALAAPAVDHVAPLGATHVSSGFRFDPTASTTLSLGAIDEQPATAPTTQPATQPASDFGNAGTQRWMITAGGGIDDDSNTLWLLGGSIEWFIADDLSLDLGVNAMYFDQEGDNAFGGGITLLVRWHFWKNHANTISIYGDGGGGFLLTSDDVPFDGGRFNFVPQLGLGASFDIGHNHRLYTGARWLHISNANTNDDNPARDSLFVYAGLSLPF
jgi:lipid A 3-O-deacylase